VWFIIHVKDDTHLLLGSIKYKLIGEERDRGTKYILDKINIENSETIRKNYHK